METVGGDMHKITAFAYQIPLVKHDKSSVTYISVFGVDSIGSEFLNINPSFAAKDLGVDPALIDSPANMTLDVLIGVDNAKLCHPTSITTPNTVPGLVLGKTNIGHVIFGTHQSFTRRSSTSTGHYRVTS